MTKAVVLLDQTLDVSERYRVELKVFAIKQSPKHPEGVKVRFVLINAVEKTPRLLIDNHEPFGFHVHEELPGNKDSRRTLKTKDYLEALDEFWRLVKEITDGKA